MVYNYPDITFTSIALGKIRYDSEQKTDAEIASRKLCFRTN